MISLLLTLVLNFVSNSCNSKYIIATHPGLYLYNINALINLSASLLHKQQLAEHFVGNTKCSNIEPDVQPVDILCLAIYQYMIA